MNGSLADQISSLGPVKAAALLAAVEIIGDGAAKIGRQEITVVAYVGLGLLLPVVLKSNPLGLTNAYWNCITNVTGVAIGFYYGERLSMRELTGVALMSAGILVATGVVLKEAQE